MKRNIRIALSLLALVTWNAMASALIAGNWKSGFVEVLVTDQLQEPTSVTVAPDGRIFVSEKTGGIRIVENGVLLPNHFLTLDVDTYGERGLSCILLDQDFDQNGYLYAYYNVRDEDHNRLSRFTANGNAVVPGSEVILMELEGLSANFHNGGAMRWGADGKLYIATGEGGDPAKSQDMNSTSGKLLRLNKDGSIPSDNPFYNSTTGNARAIYSLGFRNPFTFDIDPLSGRIFVNDVGNNNWEEVNEALRGKNYGWPIIEGYLTNETPPSGYEDPIFAYDHNVGCAVVGGAVYNHSGAGYPAYMQDTYLFSEFCMGIISMMDIQTKQVIDTLATDLGQVTNLTIDPQSGTLLFLEFHSGTLWRVEYIGTGSPFITRHPTGVLVPVGEPVTFTCTAVAADTVSYQWQLNGADLPGETQSDLSLPSPQLADSGDVYRCRVYNSLGADTSNGAMLRVTSNQRPVVSITDPVAGQTWQAGQTVTFSGGATDPETGAISAASLSWQIDFHHDAHIHPFYPLTSGIASGSFFIPEIGETDTSIWYRVHLTAEDPLGLPGTAYVDIHPEIGSFGLRTQPSGLHIFHDGAEVATPQDVNAVIGLLRTVEAPEIIVRNDSLFRFESWNGSADPILEFHVSGTFTLYTAKYVYVDTYVKGNGDGLLGEYWNNTMLLGLPEYSQIDETIDIYNGSEPMQHLEDFNMAFYFDRDDYGIRWTGDLLAPTTGNYIFAFDFDDRMRFWLNGELLIDHFKKRRPGSDSVSIDLQAGRRYAFQVDYGEDEGSAEIKLRWTPPNLERGVVPQSQLYSATQYQELIQTTAPDIILYPVPFGDVLNVVVQTDSLAAFEEVEIEIFDYSGKRLKQGTYYVDRYTPVQIDVSDLTGGALYLVRIRNGKYRAAKRALKVQD